MEIVLLILYMIKNDIMINSFTFVAVESMLSIA
jgi:hypothetical protein